MSTLAKPCPHALAAAAAAVHNCTQKRKGGTTRGASSKREIAPNNDLSPPLSLSRNADDDRSRKKKKPPSQKAAPLKSTIIDFCHRGEFCLLRRPRLLCYPSYYSSPPQEKAPTTKSLLKKVNFDFKRREGGWGGDGGVT